jgi:hypothetical protein
VENTNQRRRNGALWAGFLLMLLAVLSNGLFFIGVPGQKALPWLSLLLSVVALIFVVLALKRVFGQPEIYRGKIAAVVVSVFSFALFGLGLIAFYSGRQIPPVMGAPRVGEKVPDFNLADSDGKPVSLSQLLSGPAAGNPHPKGILLVFYRGYW